MYYTVIGKWKGSKYWDVLETFDDLVQAGAYYAEENRIKAMMYSKDMYESYMLDIVKHEFPIRDMMDFSHLVKFENGIEAISRR